MHFIFFMFESARIVQMDVTTESFFFFLSLDIIKRLMHFLEVQFLKKCGCGTI